ncbi:hypothetical protein BDV3_003193 [Batrachochytrium dendrobatidis]
MASTDMTAGSMFHLSAVLVGHSQDVKAIASLDEDTLVSASRDRQVIVWQRLVKGEASFVQKAVFTGHSHFVNSLVCVPANEKYPNGLIYSGGFDKIIYAFDPTRIDEPVYKLTGHTDNVCSLSLADNGDVLSGSWDKTAKVWRDGVQVFTLKGHTQTVWSVLALSSDTYLTASADKTIKFWVGSKNTKTLTGHSDVVRSLTRVPKIGFASCSNDGSIRIWNFDGDLLSELYGHTSFVYSLDLLGSGELVSGGEDRTIRIWNESGLVQTMTQPCISIWCVATMPNQDIATGGNDGIVRIFTRTEKRYASLDIIKAFDESVAATAISSNSVGDVDKSKLPGLEALTVHGTKDGEVKMVRIENTVEAHQWNAAEAQWIKIGEVMDAIGNSRKQIYNGKEYDHVFDVDIQEGAPPLKLPYNTGDNPLQAAQDFIQKNDLSPNYLDQIAEFITKNSTAVTLGVDPVPSHYVDPFTGGSRYVSNEASAAVSGTPSAHAIGSKSSNGSNLIPMRSYSFFKVINIKAALSKILQLNSEIEKSMEFGEVCMKPEQEKHLEKLVLRIEAGKLDDFDATDFKILSLLAFEWPEAHRFPGIDLFRVVVLHTTAPLQLDSDFVFTILRAAQLPVQDVTLLTKSQETTVMLALRALSNLFSKADFRTVLYRQRQQILNQTSELAKKADNKNLRVALATLYLNMAVMVCENETTFDDAFSVDLLEILSKMIHTETDGEALFRELIAIGTIISNSKEAREAAILLDMKSSIKHVSKVTSEHEAKLQKAETELMAYLN